MTDRDELAPERMLTAFLVSMAGDARRYPDLLPNVIDEAIARIDELAADWGESAQDDPSHLLLMECRSDLVTEARRRRGGEV